ncbi:hypothetical protein EU546_03065, partial [Candidatus Thorarchaeota archaeon]
MDDVGRMFKEAVEVGDYSASEDILDGSFSDGTLRDIISVVELKVENERSSSLAFRDHVFSYVNLEGAYFALQIPSHELLHMLRGANTREDVTNDAFELVVTLSEMRDPTMKVTEVDIESVRDTAFAVLIPWVLARRLEEMQSARIQYSQSDDANGRTRYCISQLLDTYYGRKIVWAAMGERAWDDPYDSIVVGDEVFMRMEQALRGLDLDIDGLLEVIDSNDWFKFVREVETQKARGMRSRELGLVVELAATTDQTLVENPASIERLAGAVESFRTSACNGRLKEYALGSSVDSIPIRIRCIGLLGRFGRNNDREVLAELLNDEDR